MRQIALACVMYANNHQGQYPDDWTTIRLNQDLTPDVFFCPSTSDMSLAGPTTAAIAGRLGDSSYVYLGKGMTLQSPPNAVVLYDRPENHHGEHMNVLHVDGRVEWLSKDDADKVIAEVTAGHNPPRPDKVK
jgi:prepilin-type processing-associated H-X9-DG protein